MEGVIILFFLAVLLGSARLFLRGEHRPPILPHRDPTAGFRDPARPFRTLDVDRNE